MGTTDPAETSTAEVDDRIGVDFFRTLVENGSDAIISVDEEGTIVYANRSAKRVFGYDPEGLVGEPLTKLMPERFEDRHCAAIERYLDSDERGVDWNGIELPGKHKDGHEVPLSITFEEHRYEGGRVFSGIMRDVSDRVSRERQLERQNEQLERFASVVSHDLRSPLQTAKATLAVARDRQDDDLLEELVAVHDRMESLIEDVLVLAKQGQTVGDLSTVELAAVADDAWPTTDDDSTLRVTEDVAIRADRERLWSLLENLFRNSVDHAGPDVTVTVGALDDGFYVADDGQGFGVPPERAFEHGYTSDDDGTGFGLSIVESIADAHGWTVTAANDDGVRIEFTGVELVGAAP